MLDNDRCDKGSSASASAPETAGGASRQFQIVGVDEAAAEPDRVAFLAPIARAVVGKAVGDAVTLETAQGAERLTITALTYAS